MVFNSSTRAPAHSPCACVSDFECAACVQYFFFIFFLFSQHHCKRDDDDDDGLVPFSAAFTAFAEFYVRSHKLNYGRSSVRMAIIELPFP